MPSHHTWRVHVLNVPLQQQKYNKKRGKKTCTKKMYAMFHSSSKNIIRKEGRKLAQRKCMQCPTNWHKEKEVHCE